MNRLDERGLWGDERPEAGAGIGPAVRVRFVNRWFYTKDGKRAASLLLDDGSVLISSLAPLWIQRLAVTAAAER